MKTNLKRKEAEAVLERLIVSTELVTGGEDQYYKKRFSDIPMDRGGFATAQIEYLMAGNAFLVQCGETGIRELDDMIRRCGADIFLNIGKIVKREMGSVRLSL